MALIIEPIPKFFLIPATVTLVGLRCVANAKHSLRPIKNQLFPKKSFHLECMYRTKNILDHSLYILFSIQHAVCVYFW